MIKVRVEFLGGLDVVFSKQRVHDLTIDAEELSMQGLIDYIVQNLITNKNDVDVFLEDDNIRPGIITLINDTDWELEGEMEYEVCDGDVISFTSTLHGG
ncbi:hypothetical protein KAFR_0L00500 [Kazachstania africana CBS 2517]|uniref:Ubiquitin-related modifier 1 n=1 Tax=Kazachstania africana (strain ATCC 22294 / BCRC 22015 / CBS 2517 / CECT 1963 / NBRC 1671 / NRRL Y-8276) TaxID=1071382 RepID=H2B207_KAZAF|nr:hypothetical protein KAFR_0L00500 [Kazachstania africana CBS 2517]CCF60657.1 hypothetical protein KAFR_0L00500 [Kazachstania africana CBS 2517]